MPIRVALSVALLTAGIASASTAAAWEMSKNGDIAPFTGRVGVKVKAVRLAEGLMACPESGPIRMTLLAKNRNRAEIRAANMGAPTPATANHDSVPRCHMKSRPCVDRTC